MTCIAKNSGFVEPRYFASLVLALYCVVVDVNTATLGMIMSKIQRDHVKNWAYLSPTYLECNHKKVACIE